MDVIYNVPSWHMKRHFGLVAFNINKLRSMAEKSLHLVRNAKQWSELSIIPEIIFLREESARRCFVLHKTTRV